MRTNARRFVAKVLCTALAVAALGASAPGCWQPPLYPLGSFCAAPATGGEYCVSADQGPDAAWIQAAQFGSLPIQVWAKWPSEVTLDQLVASQGKLGAWFHDLSIASAYVRDSRRSAESYRASMAGPVLTLLHEAADRQGQILANRLDPLGRFKAEMTAKAKAEKDPLVAEIATDKQTMAAAQAVFDKAKADAAPLATAYASLVTQFIAYRATEAAATAAYGSLSQQASAASLADLPTVEQAIVVTAQSASSQPVDLTMAAMELSAQIQVFETSSQSAIAPYEDFMATHGAAMPDMTSDAQRSIHAMLGYVQQRVKRSDATATTLLAGIAMRKKALEMLAAPPPPPLPPPPPPTPSAKDVIAAVQVRRAFLDAARAKVEAHRAERSSRGGAVPTLSAVPTSRAVPTLRTTLTVDGAVRGTEAK